MKKTLLVLILTLPFWGLGGCNKDDDKPADPVNLLPPITQTGAGTFGALVDGKPFIGKNPYFNCYYQFVDGGYYFGLGGEDERSLPQYIYILSENIQLKQGETYELLDVEKGNAYGGGGFIFSYTSSSQSYTNKTFTGELTITKLDFTNNIVSGTFWFDLKHPVTGERVKIREGRFDTRFTQ